MKTMKTLPSRSTLLSSLVTLSSAVALLISAAPLISAPPPSPVAAKKISPYTVTERGPHHRVWSRVTAQTNQLGQVHYHTNSYTELATGMHVKKNGQWVEASEEIEITPDGAVAGNGQHQVKFAGNINTANAIELTTPDGKKLKSHILGLSYFDTSTGKSVLIAELKDSHGELLPTKNQALYPDAFTDFRADVRYTYTLSGFEQDIILREQPPAPAEYGLNPETTHLQVLTEFADAPEPGKKAVPSKRNNAVVDEALDFGVMKMARGKAFSLGDQKTLIPVYKQWAHLEGRTFLVEEVEVTAVGNELQALPKPAASSQAKPSKNSIRHQVFNHRVLPEPKLALKDSSKFKLASLSPRESGFVLDYTTINGSLSDYTFQSDTTYYVSGVVNITGATTFEGGAVIKYTNSISACINVGMSEPVVMPLDPYRPVIFTAKDDDTVGDVISGSTGTPSGYYGNSMLTMGSGQVSGARFSYADGAVFSIDCTYRNVQFIHCRAAIIPDVDANIWLYNVLAYDFSSLVDTLDNFFLLAENLTAHNGTTFVTSGYPGVASISLSNSLVVNVASNSPGCLLGNSFWLANDTGVFQTVGAASHYLAPNSPYRNAGTTNIYPTLLADLKTKTTYPPLVRSNTTISANTTYLPQAQRDTDVPDLGYHYDPLDYVFSGVTVTNAALTLSNGVAIGIIPLGYTRGIGIDANSRLISTGSALKPNHIVGYNCVQEQANTNWMGSGTDFLLVEGAFGGQPNAAAQMRFTEFDLFADGGVVFHAYAPFSTTLRDCIFHAGGGNIEFEGGSSITNCLFDRTWINTFADFDPFNISFANNLFRGGRLTLDPSIAFELYNNHFTAGVTIIDGGGGGANLLSDYNAFSDGAAALPATGLHDVSLINPAFRVGALGSYYLPTNSPLVNAGSVNANLLGLYHYTTQAGQTKETNSIVDIGFHYVAVNNNNQPIDTDGDGLADYFEDVNGNGTYESASDLSNWNVVDSDGDGITDAQEILDGTNPLNPFSALPRQLGYWRFDTTNWLGDQGQVPLSFTNAQSVVGWNNKALKLGGLPGAANLKYRDVETNLSANITLPIGSIRFRFKPSWSSGTGPGLTGRLLELGMKDTTNGDWGIYINTNGTQLSFITQTNNTGATNLSTTINWSANHWHYLVLTYTPTNSLLYLDGAPVITNGLGVTYYPDAAVRAATGFNIGSDKDGGNQVNGTFDDLESFNYPLDAQAAAAGSFVVNMASPQDTLAEAGQAITITYNWQGGPVTPGLTFVAFMHNSNNVPVFVDGSPAVLDTPHWTGSNSLTRTITIPPGTPVGTYRILLALVNNSANARLWMSPGSGVVPAPGQDGQTITFQVGTILVTNGVRASLTSPVDQAVLTAGTPVNISGSGSSSFGSIQKLEFFVNSVKVGEVAGANGSVSWTPPGNGNYSLSLIATDVYGVSASQAVTVGVGAPVGIAITSPADQQIFGEVQTISLTTSNTLSGVTNVSFFADGVLIGSSTSSPFSFAWTNCYSGLRRLTAVAYANSGVVATSAPVRIDARYITVNQLTPSVLIGRPGQSLSLAYNFLGGPSAGNYQVALFCVSSNNAISFGDGFSPTPITSQWSNYTTLTRSMPIPADALPGTYKLMALLTPGTPRLKMMPGPGVLANNIAGLQLTYQVGLLKVLAGATSAIPSVAITNLTQGQQVLEGPLPIIASASETGGTITNVDFYANGTLIGSSTNAPYTFVWHQLVADSYTLRAVAYDNNGFSTTSEGITIFVQYNVDTDGDGILDWWEITYGLNPHNSSDALADPDGDGWTNLQEYQNGTSPNGPNDLGLKVKITRPRNGSIIP